MAKKRALDILITFKSDERWLYDEICSHSSKGGWVKDVLKAYLKAKNIEPPTSQMDTSIYRL